ncbi:MAG: heme exporter protein CcmD [Pseudomonadota bacterium]|nr:heme exporter protein CcmD [Pseudomonadota bacterium]
MSFLTPWWNDLGAFVQMGKHGAYVWPAFGVCALALALEWAGLRRQARRLRGQAPAVPPLAAGEAE